MANTCMEPKKSPFPRLATGLIVFNAMKHILSENEEI